MFLLARKRRKTEGLNIVEIHLHRIFVLWARHRFPRRVHRSRHTSLLSDVLRFVPPFTFQPMLKRSVRRGKRSVKKNRQLGNRRRTRERGLFREKVFKAGEVVVELLFLAE